ncbi:MAG TPA: hypothetical protein VF541_17410 [Longimicrobium sp.]|jgi:hypothetical protein
MKHSLAVFLTVQLAFAALTLAFGLLALRVAPRPGRNVRLGAWFLTGATFVTIGGLATLTGALAFPAMIAGEGTLVYRISLAANPIGNEARAFAVFGFALALLQMMMRRRHAPPPHKVAAALAVLLMIGGAVGALEGSFELGTRYAVMSTVTGATVVTLFAALYAALVTDQVDLHLWVSLAVYSVREALSSIVEAARSAGFLANVWMPSRSTIIYLGIVSVAVMIWCTLVRLGWARGAEPPALMERLGG